MCMYIHMCKNTKQYNNDNFPGKMAELQTKIHCLYMIVQYICNYVYAVCGHGCMETIMCTCTLVSHQGTSGLSSSSSPSKTAESIWNAL